MEQTLVRESSTTKYGQLTIWPFSNYPLTNFKIVKVLIFYNNSWFFRQKKLGQREKDQKVASLDEATLTGYYLKSTSAQWLKVELT